MSRPAITGFADFFLPGAQLKTTRFTRRIKMKTLLDIVII
jgi:hypothetical protein